MLLGKLIFSLSVIMYSSVNTNVIFINFTKKLLPKKKNLKYFFFPQGFGKYVNRVN